MMEYIEQLSGIISGICFLALAVRKKLPLLGLIFKSPRRIKELSYIDKFLFLTMLILFLISFFLALHFTWKKNYLVITNFKYNSYMLWTGV